MDLSTLIQILNNPIPAGIIGGVVSEAIIRLIDKIKAKFDGKEITKEKLERLMNENADLKEALIELENELAKENIIINKAEKIEVKNQFNAPVYYPIIN